MGISVLESPAVVYFVLFKKLRLNIFFSVLLQSLQAILILNVNTFVLITMSSCVYYVAALLYVWGC